MNTIGFDLDGVLDRPEVADMALSLLSAGWDVHIITGVFSEAKWQNAKEKRAKLKRIDIPFHEGKDPNQHLLAPSAALHILTAVSEAYPRDYRLADIGLRKGALCEKLGIRIYIDDSATYCELVPKMSGATTVMRVI